MMRGVAFKLIKTVAVLGICAGVAGCSSDEGVSPADTFAGKLLRGTTEPAHVPDPDDFKKIAHCPKVSIRPGTQTHLVTQRVRGQASPKILFQGTITKTARECDTSSGNLVMRIGFAGRLLSGPEGKAGNVRLPVRIVALIPSIDGSEREVLYSKLHQVDVTLPEGKASVSWAKIDEDVSMRLDNRIKVYVGFDSSDGAKKKRR